VTRRRTCAALLAAVLFSPAVARAQTQVQVIQRQIATSPVFVAQGTLSADAQALSTTATWNNIGTTFTHWKATITDTNSATASLALSIKGGAAGTTNLFSVDKSGSGSFGATTTVIGAAGWGFAGRGYTFATADGVFILYNSALTDFTRQCYGGTTSSFPCWKRSGAGLISRLADDSANGFVTASFFNGNASSVISSNTTIAPTGNLHHISGTTAIATITVPAGCTPTCQITLVPDGLWTTTTAGNISLASTAVVNKALIMTWDGTKWNPSY
jgi:hypothetical protein